MVVVYYVSKVCVLTTLLSCLFPTWMLILWSERHKGNTLGAAEQVMLLPPTPRTWK